jgi:hypothetical protein
MSLTEDTILQRVVVRRTAQKRAPITAHGSSGCYADVWSADFKGKFRMGNKVYCYPLTIADSVDSHIKLNKPSHEQLNNFAGKLTDRPPCGKAAG